MVVLVLDLPNTIWQFLGPSLVVLIMWSPIGRFNPVGDWWVWPAPPLLGVFFSFPSGSPWRGGKAYSIKMETKHPQNPYSSYSVVVVNSRCKLKTTGRSTKNDLLRHLQQKIYDLMTYRDSQKIIFISYWWMDLFSKPPCSWKNRTESFFFHVLLPAPRSHENVTFY